MRGVAQVAAHDVDELRVPLRGPDSREMADQPERETDDPEPQAEPDRRRERSVGDGDGARGSGQQDRLGQRAMHRREEAGDVVGTQPFATAHGVPPSERSTGASRSTGLNRSSPSDQDPAAEGEEGQEEARRREGDRQTEDDLHQSPRAAGAVAEGERQAGDDDDHDGDDLGHRAFDRFQDRLQRRFPGHARARGVRGRRHQGNGQGGGSRGKRVVQCADHDESPEGEGTRDGRA